ncbi:clamp loader A subunit [Microcystis phage Mel-JY01]
MAKNLFDHLNGITRDKVPWEDLTDEDRKSWNTYNINRWLSMEPEFITFINAFQNFTIFSTMTDEQYYKILYQALPKKRFYFNYIKRKRMVMIDEYLFKIFVEYFQDRSEIVYNNIVLLAKIDQDSLISILKMYGVQSEVLDKFKNIIDELKLVQ